MVKSGELIESFSPHSNILLYAILISSSDYFQRSTSRTRHRQLYSAVNFSLRSTHSFSRKKKNLKLSGKARAIFFRSDPVENYYQQKQLDLASL